MLWRGLVILIIGVSVRSDHLYGDNICQFQEKYNITLERTYTINATVREFIWCFNVPPRCSSYRTEKKNVTKIEVEEKSKNYTRCCDGYKEDDTHSKCLPVCTKCVHGECVKAEHCTCNSGYTGMYCELKCQNGKWGRNCGQDCGCKNRAACDAETGNCQCDPDWTGSLCDVPIVQDTTEINDESTDCRDCGEMEVSQMFEELENSTDINIIPHDSSNEDNIVIVDPNMDLTDFMTEIPMKKNLTILSEMITTIKIDQNTKYWPMEQMVDRSNKMFILETLSIGIATAVFILFIIIVLVFILRYKNIKASMTKCQTQTVAARLDDKLESKPVTYRSSYHAPLSETAIVQNPIFMLVTEETINHRMEKRAENYENIEETIDLQYDYPPPTVRNCRSICSRVSEPLYHEI